MGEGNVVDRYGVERGLAAAVAVEANVWARACLRGIMGDAIGAERTEDSGEAGSLADDWDVEATFEVAAESVKAFARIGVVGNGNPSSSDVWDSERGEGRTGVYECRTDWRSDGAGDSASDARCGASEKGEEVTLIQLARR